MNEIEFWEIIEIAKLQSSGDIEVQTDFLINHLEDDSLDNIKTFYHIYYYFMIKSYFADLWDVCDLITCAGGEQNFLDFRAWLIAQGKNRYYKTIEDPESLVEIVAKENRYEIGYERFSYIALYAYENKTGHEMKSDKSIEPTDLQGKQVERGKLHEKFPKLAHHLGDCY